MVTSDGEANLVTVLVYFAAIVPSSLIVAICLVVIVEYTYTKKKAVVYPSAHKSTRVSLHSMMRLKVENKGEGEERQEDGVPPQ